MNEIHAEVPNWARTLRGNGHESRVCWRIGFSETVL